MIKYSQKLTELQEGIRAEEKTRNGPALCYGHRGIVDCTTHPPTLPPTTRGIFDFSRIREKGSPCSLLSGSREGLGMGAREQDYPARCSSIACNTFSSPRITSSFRNLRTSIFLVAIISVRNASYSSRLRWLGPSSSTTSRFS